MLAPRCMRPSGMWRRPCSKHSQAWAFLKRSRFQLLALPLVLAPAWKLELLQVLVWAQAPAQTGLCMQSPMEIP